MIEQIHIEASIRDCKSAVDSSFFSGTFATAIASLIQVAEEAMSEDNDDKEKAVETLEAASMALDEMERSFDRAFSAISDLEDRINIMQSDFEDAKVEVNDGLVKLRGY